MDFFVCRNTVLSPSSPHLSFENNIPKLLFSMDTNTLSNPSTSQTTETSPNNHSHNSLTMLSPPTSEDSFDGKPKTIDMALYSLTRARKAIAKLEARDEDHAEAVASAKSANNPSQQPAAAASAVANLDYRWTNADTASFDCMHYNGDAALDLLAQRIDLQPGPSFPLPLSTSLSITKNPPPTH